MDPWSSVPLEAADVDQAAQPQRGRGRALLLFLGGAGCLVLSALSLLVATLNADLGVHTWPSSETLPVDSQAHSFRLPEHQTTMVWVYEAENAPSCTFTDTRTQERLAPRPSRKDYFRGAGSAGGYRGERVFDSGSGQVAARCSGDKANLPVYLEKTPRLPPFADYLGLPGLIAMGWALTGLVLIALAIVIRARRPQSRSAI